MLGGFLLSLCKLSTQILMVFSKGILVTKESTSRLARNSFHVWVVKAVSRLWMQFPFFANALFWASGHNLGLKHPANSCKGVAFAAGTQWKPMHCRVMIWAENLTFFKILICNTLLHHEKHCISNNCGAILFSRSPLRRVSFQHKFFTAFWCNYLGIVLRFLIVY